MRERRWLELIKDYDVEVHYHFGTANVVADAFSRKVHYNHVEVEPYSDVLCKDMRKIQLDVVEQRNLYAIVAESNLYDRIVIAQRDVEGVQQLKQNLAEGDPKYTCFQKDAKDVIWFGKSLVIPANLDLKKEIFVKLIFPNSLFTPKAPRCIKI
jgi:hypothetical protein